MYRNYSVALSFTNDFNTTEHVDQNCHGSESKVVEVVCKALAYFLILIVSSVGNLLVLLITYKSKQLRKPISFFVFNMAVSDLVIPLTIMPIKIVDIISGSDSWKVESPWMLGNILCKLCYFLPDVSLVVSIGSLFLISMDRFVATIFPLCTKFESLKARLIGILFIWIVAIGVYAPYFYTFTLEIHPYDKKTYCISLWGLDHMHVETNNRFVTATFIAFILVPVCVFAIVYGTIAWA